MVEQTPPKVEGKKKKSFWGKFATFLAMGGWMLILIVIIGIVIAISIITS